MGRKRRREIKVVEGVEIERAGAEGKAIAHIDGQVLFVPHAAPGDVATVEVKKTHRKYLEGKILSIEKPSKQRTQPFCEHYGICGGCKWQHMAYPHQLAFKEQQVRDNLERIAKVNLPEISPIIGAKDIKGYRNKMEYTATNSKWLTIEEIQSGENIDRDGIGFHMPGRFDRVFELNTCYLAPDLSNQIRQRVFELAKALDIPFFALRDQTPGLRTVMIRSSSLGEWMVLISLKEVELPLVKELCKRLQESFPEITSLNYAINNKRNDSMYDLEINHFSGATYIQEKLGDLIFKINPKSFFQTNTKQAETLYDITLDFAGLKGDEVVYDLYTGTGTIACFLAKKAQKVVGIEYVEAAIEDAKQNASDNKIKNTSFFAGDMKDVFTDAFVAKNGKPDVIVTDPPRAGMHEDVINVIKDLAPSRVVYVSCNPATQARDLHLLDSVYNVAKVQPVDMFPHTHHVENVVLLEKKSR